MVSEKPGLGDNLDKRFALNDRFQVCVLLRFLLKTWTIPIMNLTSWFMIVS